MPEDKTFEFSVTAKFGQALGRCAMIGWEGADAADLDMTEEELANLGALIETLQGLGQ